MLTSGKGSLSLGLDLAYGLEGDAEAERGRQVGGISMASVELF